MNLNLKILVILSVSAIRNKHCNYQLLVSVEKNNKIKSQQCSLLYSTRVLLVNISLPVIHVEPQTQYGWLYGQKTSLSGHILCCSSTCFSITFSPQTCGRPADEAGAHRKNVVKTYRVKATDLAHRSSAFYSCQVLPWGPATCISAHTHTRSNPNDWFKRGFIPVFEWQEI